MCLKETRDCSPTHAPPPLHKTMLARFRKRIANKVVKIEGTRKNMSEDGRAVDS